MDPKARASRIKWFTKEVNKKLGILRTLEAAQESIRQSLSEMVADTVISMERFKSLKIAVGLNATNLQVARTELKMAKLQLEAETNASKADKKQVTGVLIRLPKCQN